MGEEDINKILSQFAIVGLFQQEPGTPSSVDSSKPEIASKPALTPTPQQAQQQQQPVAHDPQFGINGPAHLGPPIGGVSQFGQPVGGVYGPAQPLGVPPMAQVLGQSPMATNPNIMHGTYDYTLIFLS